MSGENNSVRAKSPIGIFDSGFGGLTVLSEIKSLLPQYSYIYLGDNMRAPYGSRSFDTVYQFTLEAVKWLFEQNCQLVILACNTASAKALRSIQQNDLPHIDPGKRVLGVIRPTVEIVDRFTNTGHIGVLGTSGTIRSQSYNLEISKLHPQLTVSSEACPMWVPLVENNEYDKPGADYYVKQHIDNLLRKDDKIDTIILGCTHYPLLVNKIIQYLPDHIRIISQGEYVARSLENYLERHPEMEEKCSKESIVKFYTTDSQEEFQEFATSLLKENIEVEKIKIDSL